MAKKKANSFIDRELKWLEKKAQELRDYCDQNIISELTDRTVGNKVVQTIEQQIKCIRETEADYIKIIQAINELREKEDVKKLQVRGGMDLSPLEAGDIN